MDKNGFTLIELLLITSIIAVLAGGVFVALNPVKRFRDANNARRWEDVNSILNAIHQYVVDNNGALPDGIDTKERQLGICTSDGDKLCSSAENKCLDISSALAQYLKSMPVDPKSGSAKTTGYAVSSDENNLITIKSCAAEGGESIEVSR